MLGWEFPPVINGGLGVACHDLSSAMSELANITMVVPRSSPGFKVKNVNLLGINSIDINSIENIFNFNHRQLPFTLHSVPSDLDPYYMENNISFQDRSVINGYEFKRNLGGFNIENLYGDDVINKVFQYANIVSALASTLDFDVIHAHDWMTMLAGVKIKQQSGKPLVMHIHSLEERNRQQGLGI